jgi:hypothetical protein
MYIAISRLATRVTGSNYSIYCTEYGAAELSLRRGGLNFWESKLKLGTIKHLPASMHDKMDGLTHQKRYFVP